MRRALISTSLFVCLALLFAPGCIPSDGADGSGADTGTQPEECCSKVRVCETRCTDFHCWDDCDIQTQCAADCRSTCAGDLDCPKDEVCLEGQCVTRDWNRTGTGGLCQTCETAYDCAEPDSRCVRLYFDRTPEGGPKICATHCERDSHCPWDFECVDRSDTGRVCVPRREFGSTDRVCDPDELGDDAECFSSEHCGPAESCIENQCVVPDGECTSDADCGDGETCRNFQCEPEDDAECVTRTDCRSSEICVDGQCTPRNDDSQCVRNDECQGDAVCVEGECLARCSDRSECNRASEICRQGLCVPIECRYNSDCGPDETCVDAQCRTACRNASDCTSGYRCSETGGFCERDPDVECRSDAECLSSEVCHQDTCSAVCNCNQQCPAGQVCNDEASDASNTGLCETPDDSGSGGACESGCDCPSGQTCEDGTCQSRE